MPVESLLSNPNPDVPRSRSILSRFTKPLAKHNRNIVDFSIEPESQWKWYSPGDVVRGHVVLAVNKGFDITHLVVSLHGYVRVHKTWVPIGDDTPSDILLNARGSLGFQYHGKGIATLFQDEVVLCGAGFLKKQVYRFGFELEFPQKGIPTKLNFERGTISYIISAKLTRPTTLSPVWNCYKHVLYEETIDVGTLPPPRPQSLCLEAVSKRGKIRGIKKNPDRSSPAATIRSNLPRSNTENSLNSNLHSGAINPPLSPTPSDDTTRTSNSTSSTSFRVINNLYTQGAQSRENSQTRSSSTSNSTRTITATTELGKAGVLPGDSVSLRITISHTRPVRGVVIATLYRQGHIDMYPEIPAVSARNGRPAEYEDLYPRSITGLGGLYFSNATPSSSFRMDLAQSSNMMVIDPTTLTAEVKMSIRVPDNTFPTISNVPGGMVYFNYHIEIVIDLCGKLGEARYLPRITSTEPKFSQAQEAGSQLKILDTAQLRRTKNVVAQIFPLTVGTVDSLKPALKAKGPATEHGQQDYYVDQHHDESYWADQGDYYEGDGEYYEEDYGYDGQQEYDPEYHSPPMDLMPPPQPEEYLDEKSRLRQQEQYLLPSAPPQAAESSSSAQPYAPSAPPAELLNNHHYDQSQSAPPFTPPAPPPPPPLTDSGTSVHSTDTVVPTTSSSPSSHLSGRATRMHLADDKQELERQRLMAQASAPPPVEDVDEHQQHHTSSGDGAAPPASSGPSARDLAPSAPVILDDNDGDNAQDFGIPLGLPLSHPAHTTAGDDAGDGENLPIYRR